MTDTRKWNYSSSSANLAILAFPVVRRCRDHLPILFRPLQCVVANPRFAVGFSVLSVIVSAICVFPVSVCNEIDWEHFLASVSGRKSRFAFGISTYIIFLEIKYFRFWWPHCYFRLSDVVEITVFELDMVDCLRFAVEKRQIYIVFLLKSLWLFYPSST